MIVLSEDRDDVGREEEVEGSIMARFLYIPGKTRLVSVLLPANHAYRRPSERQHLAREALCVIGGS